MTTDSGTGEPDLTLPRTDKIWFDGELIAWDDANIHILSHVVHYGSCVFEGIRCYETPAGSACFRLTDHMRRLANSAKVYRMAIPYSIEELCGAVRDVIRANGLTECYVRPIVLRGLGTLGVSPLSCPLHTSIAVWPWGDFFGDGVTEEGGVDACTSSWQRPSPNSLPLMAKAGGNYLNSQLIKIEALEKGFHEGIALDAGGHVSEASGENVFIVVDGGLVTPPSNASILPGITRHTVIQLARAEGLKVNRQLIPREALYMADEVFLCGSAAEVTAVRSVDRIPVGAGKRGPITRLLAEKYRALVTGRTPAPDGWVESF